MDICPSCKLPPLPRGVNATTGVCWTCEFSRKSILPLTEAQWELIKMYREDS